MPFKSKAQMRLMYAKHPKIAERWAEETPNEKKLPEKAKKKSPWVDMGKKGDK